VIHHPAAALSTTCGADGGRLTLSLSSYPFPSHPPFSLPSSRAPTRGTSANQSAFPHRGPSFRFPVRRPARVGLSASPPGQEEGAGTTPVCTNTLSRAGLDRHVHACAWRFGRTPLDGFCNRVGFRARPGSFSNPNHGADGRPSSPLDAALPSVVQCCAQREHGCLWVARYLSEQASRTWMGQGPASTPPTNTLAIARERALLPRPTGSGHLLSQHRGFSGVCPRGTVDIAWESTVASVFPRAASEAFPRRKTDYVGPRCLPSGDTR